MKKQLNTSTMENELRQGSVFFQKPTGLSKVRDKQKTPSTLPSPKEISKTETQPISLPETKIDKSQSTNQSISQSAAQSPELSTKQLTGKTVNRPVAFYLPEVIDQKIDEAVQYYQKKYQAKFDRSAIVSAILGDPNLWTDEALDQLSGKVTEQLTGRLTSRLTGLSIR